MSTLKVDNIRDNGSGFNDVVSFQNVNGTENGRLCRTWVNFNGVGAVAIRANFNVNSITDNGVGDYTVNFSNSMSDANYAAVSSGGANFFDVRVAYRNTNYSTGSHRIVITNNAQDVDATHVNVAIFR